MLTFTVFSSCLGFIVRMNEFIPRSRDHLVLSVSKMKLPAEIKKNYSQISVHESQPLKKFQYSHMELGHKLNRLMVAV